MAGSVCIFAFFVFSCGHFNCPAAGAGGWPGGARSAPHQSLNGREVSRGFSSGLSGIMFSSAFWASRSWRACWGDIWPGSAGWFSSASFFSPSCLSFCAAAWACSCFFFLVLFLLRLLGILLLVRLGLGLLLLWLILLLLLLVLLLILFLLVFLILLLLLFLVLLGLLLLTLLLEQFVQFLQLEVIRVLLEPLIHQFPGLGQVVGDVALGAGVEELFGGLGKGLGPADGRHQEEAKADEESQCHRCSLVSW